LEEAILILGGRKIKTQGNKETGLGRKGGQRQHDTWFMSHLRQSVSISSAAETGHRS